MKCLCAQRKELCQSKRVILWPHSGWAKGIRWHLCPLRGLLRCSETLREMAGRCLQRSELIDGERRTLQDQGFLDKVGFGWSQIYMTFHKPCHFCPRANLWYPKYLGSKYGRFLWYYNHSLCLLRWRADQQSESHFANHQRGIWCHQRKLRTQQMSACLHGLSKLDQKFWGIRAKSWRLLDFPDRSTVTNSVLH